MSGECRERCGLHINEDHFIAEIIDPDTGEQLIDPTIVRIVTTLMMLCGMYDESGEYAVKVGLPSKSGVGGGIVAISRKGVGIGTFGPMLNKKGNSVGGEKILQVLSRELGLHVFDLATF